MIDATEDLFYFELIFSMLKDFIFNESSIAYIQFDYIIEELIFKPVARNAE